MKRTKSEFVSRENRKTHAKDMQSTNPTPSQKIEETDSSFEESEMK